MSGGKSTAAQFSILLIALLKSERCAVLLSKCVRDARLGEPAYVSIAAEVILRLSMEENANNRDLSVAFVALAFASIRLDKLVDAAKHENAEYRISSSKERFFVALLRKVRLAKNVFSYDASDLLQTISSEAGGARAKAGRKRKTEVGAMAVLYQLVTQSERKNFEKWLKAMEIAGEGNVFDASSEVSRGDIEAVVTRARRARFGSIRSSPSSR
jgi:hypothetical protein